MRGEEGQLVLVKKSGKEGTRVSGERFPIRGRTVRGIKGPI